MPEPEPQAEQPAANVAPVPTAGPPASASGQRSKTEVFRDRMAEIKKTQGSASKSGATQDAVPPEEPAPAPAPKKKGCMSLVLLGFVLVSGAVAGSWNWIF